MKVHYNISVEGMVQGVWYRTSAKDMAVSLGIKGYAMNQQDGSVFIEAEGDEEQLEHFVAWCRMGPQKARVASVNIENAALKNFEIFTIRR